MKTTAAQAAWRKTHRAEINAYVRAYRAAKPEIGREWVRKNNAERRQRAVEYLGGKCVDCGNDDPRVLEFDHVEEPSLLPSGKRATIPNLLLLKWEVVMAELDRCVLRCANCHRIRTNEQAAERAAGRLAAHVRGPMPTSIYDAEVSRA